MPDDFIKIDVVGEEKIIKALQQYPKQVGNYLTAAGQEAARRIILPTQGLQKYPPGTAANRPPTPYYIRGRGMQYKSRNTESSEKLGTQFYAQPEKSGFSTEIGNRASYADYVVGTGQAGFMKPKGWKVLAAVAEEKRVQIVAVYQAWVDKLFSKLGL